MQTRIGSASLSEVRAEIPRISSRTNIPRVYQTVCRFMFAITLAVSVFGTALLIMGEIKEHGVLAFWLPTYLLLALSWVFRSIADESQEEINIETGIRYVFAV